MSEMRVNIIDKNQTVSCEIHESFGDVLAALPAVDGFNGGRFSFDET
jgi:hypothetical protein